MILQSNSAITETPIKLWMKRLSWALPLFFLTKGLVWLALPLLLAVYGFH